MPKTHGFDCTIGIFRTERGANQRLMILDGGPHGEAGVALIPEAGVLVGDPAEGRRLAEELQARPVLTEGDVVQVRGFGDEVYVARRVEHNGDWWRLVPVGMLRHGRRYYIDFQGHGMWKIRDAMHDGRAVAHEVLQAVELGRITSLADARLAVDRLHEEQAQRPNWGDYLRAMGQEPEAPYVHQDGYEGR